MPYFDVYMQALNGATQAGYTIVLYVCVLRVCLSHTRLLYNATTAQAIQNEYFLAPCDPPTDCIWPRPSHQQAPHASHLNAEPCAL